MPRRRPGRRRRTAASVAVAALRRAALAEVRALEDFFAFPGVRLMKSLAERISDDDALAVGRLARRISGALLSGSYRYDSSEWEGSDDEDGGNVPDRLPFDTSGGTPAVFRDADRLPGAGRQLCQDRPGNPPPARFEDPMIYEPVLVGSFEDAIVATIMNGKIEAVVIYDGIPVPSQHDVPLVRDFLASHLQLDTSSLAPREIGVTLAATIKRIRPELDLYLLTDRNVEKLAGDPAATMIRRVFYEVEELTEVHLNILEGVADRVATPHFDNLKRYAARPIGTFHALPIARGKSIMKSNWIRDMGEFYGQNLFLAESSSTAGGSTACSSRPATSRSRGEVRPRRRSGPRLLRDQRHFHVQQDGLPGGVQAGRYRDCGPQLPQIAPLRHGVVGRTASLCRSVPDD